MLDLSVIVLTYNPSWPKLRGTLLSAVRQEGLSMEIILSDDGSADSCQDRAKAFLESHSFPYVQYCPWPENEGTVASLCKALEKVRGRYIYVISPGDFFYDAHTLSNMTAFCDERRAKIAFGEAVFYSQGEDGDVILPKDRLQAPSRPDLYRDTNLRWQKTAFLFLDYILGAAYLRETETLKTLMARIRSLVRYAEDTPSTLFALAEGIPVHYFPEPVVWYECGTGISDGKSEKWAAILREEYRRTYDALLKAFPKDPVVRAAWRYKVQKDEKEPVWKQVLRTPKTVLDFYRRRGFPVRTNSATEENREKLTRFLKETNQAP